MDTTCGFATGSIPGAKVLAGLLGAVALAGIYPVAATMAKAMTTSFRLQEAKPAAPSALSTPAAERNTLGLPAVRGTQGMEATERQIAAWQSRQKD